MPRKIALASTPATRIVSMAPSSASMANARCTSTSRLNIVASQMRPGATCSSTVSLSRANAKMTIVTPANGSTWFVTTRLRRSIRRSLPATSRLVRQNDGERDRRSIGPPAHRRQLPDLAGDDLHGARRQCAGTVEFMAGHDDRGSGLRKPGAASRRVRLAPLRRGRRVARRAARARRVVPPGTQGRCADAGRPTAARPGTSTSRPPTPRRVIAASISAGDAPTVAPQKLTFSRTVRSR